MIDVRLRNRILFTLRVAFNENVDERMFCRERLATLNASIVSQSALWFLALKQESLSSRSFPLKKRAVFYIFLFDLMSIKWKKIQQWMRFRQRDKSFELFNDRFEFLFAFAACGESFGQRRSFLLAKTSERRSFCLIHGFDSLNEYWKII